MSKNTINNHHNKGSALVLAVIAIVIILILGSGMLSLGFVSRVYYTRTSSDIAARCAADAALEKAIYQINALFQSGELSELPTESNISLEGCDASYSYQITQQPDGTYIVQATGVSNGAIRTVQAELEITNPFEFALFSQQNITLKNSASIDWYNYDADDEPLKVATNSTNNGAVELKNSAEIDGDVLVGPGGDPDTVIVLRNSATITGETSAQSSATTLPSVTVPTYLQLLPSGGTISNNTTLYTSGKYDEIDLGNSKTLTIRGPVELYVTGDVTLGNSAKIEIDETYPNSSLTLYISGDLETKNSSSINNNTHIPKKFKLYGLDTCTSLAFKNSSDVYGVIYAPKADIIFHNSADIYGSIIGKNIEMKNSSKLHYDASLRDDMTDDSLVSLKIGRWSE